MGISHGLVGKHPGQSGKFTSLLIKISRTQHGTPNSFRARGVLRRIIRQKNFICGNDASTDPLCQ